MEKKEREESLFYKISSKICGFSFIAFIGYFVLYIIGSIILWILKIANFLTNDITSKIFETMTFFLVCFILLPVFVFIAIVIVIIIRECISIKKDDDLTGGGAA
jgi:hypothetical protein